MDKLRRCYEMLGLTPGASWDEIRQAYKDSVSVWHPDRFVNNPRLQQKAEEKIKDINAAYEKISTFFKEYGTPNFANHAKPYEQQSQEPPKEPEEEVSPSQEPENVPENKYHPWLRFWARSFDLTLFFLVPAYIVGPYLRYNIANNSILWIYIIFVFAFVLESLTMTLFGNTPGKSLLNIKVVKTDSSSVGFTDAITRSLNVWLIGYAAGLPFIPIFSLSYCYLNAKKHNGNAPWDRKNALAVVHTPVALMKSIIFTILFIALCSITARIDIKPPNGFAQETPQGQIVPTDSVKFDDVTTRGHFSDPSAIKYADDPSSIKFVVQFDDCNNGISTQYRFFDETNNLVWPSSDKVYIASQYKVPLITEISCKPGANICIGAAPYSDSPSTSWGVGINNELVTTIGCVTCGSVPEKHVKFSCPDRPASPGLYDDILNSKTK